MLVIQLDETHRVRAKFNEARLIVNTDSDSVPGINVPFLNMLSNIRARAGAGPIVRVGGNSQENTQLFLTPFESEEIINKTILTTPTNPVSHTRSLCHYP